MRKLLIVLGFCCSVAAAQDHPYFVLDAASSTNGGIAPVIDFWWHSADISSNNPIATWNDRVVGMQLVQTNDFYKPTNSASGVCFDGTKSLEFINTLKVPTNSSVFVSGYFSAMPHNQIIIYSTNGNEGLYINATNQAVTRYGGGDYLSSVLNPTNFVSFGYTTQTNTSNLQLVAYVNGVQISSNFFAGTSSSLDMIGGWSDEAIGQPWGYLDYSLYGYITDIMVWTNDTLIPDNFVFLHAMVSTNSATKEPFFNPASFGATLYSWLRADNPTIGPLQGGPHTNGAQVTYFSESCNYTPDTGRRWNIGGGSPTWYSSLGPNSSPAVVLSGGWFQFPLDTPTRAQPNTYFFVCQATNTTISQCLFDQDVGRQAIYTSFTGPTLVTFAGSLLTFNYPTTITSSTILTVRFDGTSSWIRTNGVDLAISAGSSAGTDVLSKPRIGVDSTSGSPFYGRFSEFLAYTGSLSTNDIQNVEQMLRNKYGL